MRQVVQDVEALVTDLESGWNRKTLRFAGIASAGANVIRSLALWVCAGVVATFASAPASVWAQQSPTAGDVRVQHDPPRDFQPPEQVLAKANAAYESGRFADAVDAYRRAEALGVRNGPLYYNMGNAHYKNGDLALAIAAYRRAERLIPRDPLLRANLDFVLSQREDKAVQAPVPWPLSWARQLFRWLSLNEWVLVTTALYGVVCVLALFVVLGRRRRLPLRVALYTTLALFLLSTTTLAYKIHDERNVERGVVTAERISVMSGPGQDYTVEFWLHTGTEVEVEVRRPDWLRIALGNELRGWIPASAVVDI